MFNATSAPSVRRLGFESTLQRANLGEWARHPSNFRTSDEILSTKYIIMMEKWLQLLARPLIWLCDFSSKKLVVYMILNLVLIFTPTAVTYN